MAKFVDRVVVHATAGAGGNGCASVHREKFKPLGGPDGGTEEVVVGGKLVRLTSGTSVEVARQESAPDVASID